ncbi:PXA domain-containing protein [Phycomyces blakesleeanus]|uniref:PXA domain-containing protein n=1 Tax=Phycomyces blakesleeanus TaxID=4837 RepID=A0ABR3AGQ1_PHYBL
MAGISIGKQKAIVAIVLLVVVFGTQWPYSLRSLTAGLRLVMVDLCALLVLNLSVLYIYAKYVVSSSQDRFNERQKRNEFPSLFFAKPKPWAEAQAKRKADNTFARPAVAESPEIAEAFEELLSYVLRDFVDFWFVHLSGSIEEKSFPSAVDHIIRTALLNLKGRLEDKDLMSIVLNRLMPIITLHISEFREAEVSLRGRSLERSVTQSDELDLLLASQFRGGKLHPALTTAAVTTKPTEIAYLRQVIDRIMPYIFDKKDIQSNAVALIIREMATCAVLQPTFDMLADPDFWNQTIDIYLAKAIREQNIVRKVREVLNRHSKDMDDNGEETFEPENETSLGNTNPRSGPSREKIGPMNQFSAAFLGTGLEEAWDEQEEDADTKRIFGFGSTKMGRQTFQDFLKMIESEKNLLDLKRVRNDIITQIRKKKALTLERDPEEVVDGEKVEDVNAYVNRLSVAKKRVDKRIALLSGENYEKRSPTSQLFGSRKQSTTFTSQTTGYTLYDILTNTAGLSYFMEFMDRRGDMVKLQFWLIVEGFKNYDTSDNSPQKRDEKTFFQDIKMVHEMYFADASPHRLPISENLSRDLMDAIQRAQIDLIEENESVFSETVQEMGRRLYRIQQSIFWQIEKEHFLYFKRSDLYFKYLATSPNSAPDTLPERRSLDESTLYRRPSAADLLASSRPPLETIASSSMERTSSARIAKSDKWDHQESPKAESDTEGRGSRRSTMAHSGSDKLKPPLSYNRSRRHVRARSETSNRPSKFLSLGNVLLSANEWWRGEPTTSGEGSEQTSQYISPTESIKSTESDGIDTDDDVNAPKIDPAIQPPNKMERKKLVRSDTVDAVEAELQSIIDGEGVMANDQDEYTQNKSISTLPRREGSIKITKPQSFQRPSPLILYGTRGIKSSMAMPVQNDYTLPSWKSSGGTNTISEVEHDQIGPLTPRGSIKSQEQQEIHSSASSTKAPSGDNVHLAPPGDLLLASKVKQISEDVKKLMQEEALVDALIRKSEARNEVESLRLLRKIKSACRQDIQQMKYQKSQYELQESENVLERTKVSITNSTIGSDIHGEFALYVIEIHQLGTEGNYTSGWIVTRRYSEFFTLHQKLKDHYAAVKMLDFPVKWPLLKLQRSFVETRRISLERYLRRLLEDKLICQSDELRVFLSQQNVYVPGPKDNSDVDYEFGFGYFTSLPRSVERQKIFGSKNKGRHEPIDTDTSRNGLLGSSVTTPSPHKSPSMQNLQRSIASNISANEYSNNRKQSAGFMKHIYKTVAAGFDDMFIGPSMLDLITQRLGEQVMEFSYESDMNDPNSTFPHSRNTSSNGSHKRMMLDGLEINSDSLSNSFGNVELSNEALKPVENEGITRFTEPLCDLFIEMFELKEKNNWLRRQAVVIILQQIFGGTIERRLTDTLWPEGASLSFKPPRRPEEKQHTREEANRKLSTWLPDLLGSMVGRQNSRRGARRLFSVLQNKRLNQDLVYTLFDEILYELFPEVGDNK